ncbi:ABC transporter ATP-binding protein [Rossellomorea sp. GAMAL-10_SWC]
MSKLLEVKDLCVSFYTHAGEVQAVRGVSFDLKKGETLAIVGESGSGKSVTSKALMGLIPNPPGKIKSGEILFDGKDLAKLSEKEMQSIRGKEISMIFQDPMTSLNPVLTIGYQITEGLIKHQKMSKTEAKKIALELINLVGIPNAEDRFKQYPHQFSGGMRQRVVIAMALACNPKLLIADEPTTALDVTIQAQILELMKEIQRKTDSAIIFITHDLGVVANVADKVAVMYAGRVVEMGTVDDIFYNPKHPYTWGLLASMPDLDNEQGAELVAIPGTPPDLLNPPKGDAFAPRNPNALKIDYEMEPPMFKVSDTHYAATWLLHEDAPKVEPPEAVKKRIQRMKEGEVNVK